MCLVFRKHSLAVLIVVLVVPCAASGQLPVPQLKRVLPLGGQIGHSFELRIEGDDLDDASELHFSHAGITAQRKMQDTSAPNEEPLPVDNTFMVHVADDVPPGLYEVRANGYFGVSNSRVLAVDTARETTLSGDPYSMNGAAPLEVGSAVTASAAQERVHYYRIDVAAGQKVLIECLAQRLDSQMDATLVLYDETGKELRRVRDTIGRDPVLLLAPQENRQYVVGVYDFTYRGGNEHFYRITAHTEPRLLYAFPPVVEAGGPAQDVTIYGWNLPGSELTRRELSLDEAPLEQIQVAPDLEEPATVPVATGIHALFAAGVPFHLRVADRKTNPVFISTTHHPVVVESSENDRAEQAQSIPVPGEFVGRIEASGDRDWVQFSGNRGDVLTLDVIADRMGVPADVTLTLHKISIREDGSTQAQQVSQIDDDSYGRDPRIDVSSTDPTVRLVVEEPAIYRAQVRDLYDNPTGDSRMVYRLLVRRQSPEFRLAAIVEPPRGADNQPLPIGGLSVRQGGAAALIVAAQRVGGFDGAIEVGVRELPEGIYCRPVIIPPGEARATLIVSAAADAPPWSGAIEITGRSHPDGRELVRTAVGGVTTWPTPNPNTPLEARLSKSIHLAVTSAPSPPAALVCGGADASIVEVSTSVGGKVQIPVGLARRDGFEADVNLNPSGLADGLQFSAAAITKEQTETNAEIFVSKDNFKPGVYEFHLRSRIQAKLPRNPRAVAQAENSEKHLADQLRGKDEERARITAARDAAQVEVGNADALRSKFEAELVATRQNADLAAGERQARADHLAAARAALQQNAASETSDLDSLEDSQKSLLDAIEHLRAANSKLVESEAALARAEVVAEVSAARLAVLEKQLLEAQQAYARIEQRHKQAASRLEEIRKQNEPRDYEFELLSQPLRLRVMEAPFTLKLDRDRIDLLPESVTEVSVSVERMFGFEGEIQLKIILPDGSSHSAESVVAAAGQAGVTLKIQTPPNANPKRQSCQIEATAKFNDVNVRTRIPLQLTTRAKNTSDG